MKCLQQYRFGFDIYGLALFLILMLPNIIWFAVPAFNDVLRTESETPIIDTLGMVFQVLMITTLCFVRYKDVQPLRLSVRMWSVGACIVIYFIGWILYYMGVTSVVVFVFLMLMPCLAFVLYALDRKNIIAVFLAVGFTICHVWFGVDNYIL